MDLPSLVRLSSWFLPIPFMLLYHIKTKKLDFLFPALCAGALFGIILPFLPEANFGFTPDLIQFYTLAVFASFLLFYTKYELPQALSIAFCLTFFASLYWELPCHIFTTVYKGYIDQAFPVHTLFVYPGLFVWTKISLKPDRTNFLLFLSSMVVSSLSLVFLFRIGADFYITYINPPSLQYIMEVVWMFTRAFCFSALYLIFYRGISRKPEIAK